LNTIVKRREGKNLEIPFEPKHTPNKSNPFSFFTPRSSFKASVRRVQTERPDGRSEREGVNEQREEKKLVDSVASSPTPRKKKDEK
jgi:hypothetical protein